MSFLFAKLVLKVIPNGGEALDGTLECYTTRLTKDTKRSIKILAAEKGLTQQELIEMMVNEEMNKRSRVYGGK